MDNESYNQQPRKRGEVMWRNANNRDHMLAVWNETLRADGYLPSENEGFWTELGQGFGLAYLNAGEGIGSALGINEMRRFFSEAKSLRMHWNEPPGGSFGHTLGGAAFYVLIISLIVAIVCAIKARKKPPQPRD